MEFAATETGLLSVVAAFFFLKKIFKKNVTERLPELEDIYIGEGCN